MLRLFAKFHWPVIWDEWFLPPDASPATRDTRLLLSSSNLNPCVALRDYFWRITIGLLLFSKLYPYTRTSPSASTWYMIPHLTYFPFLPSRTLTVRPCCNLPVFCSWDVHDEFHKNRARSIFFGPSSDQRNPRESACAKYQIGTI